MAAAAGVWGSIASEACGPVLAAKMGCGQSKAARAVAPLPASQAGEWVAAGAIAVEAEPQLISADEEAAAEAGGEGRAQQEEEEETVAQKMSGEEGGQAVSASGSGDGDDPALPTTAETAPSAARPHPVVVEFKAVRDTDGSGGGSSAALPPSTHAPASMHPPAHRPTLLPVELRGGKISAFESMVPMMEAQLLWSLEDVTGPIDPQQVQKPPAPRTALSPASNHVGLGHMRRTSV